MTISGQFRDIDDRVVEVTIISQQSGNDITIGENGLYFTGDPITIQSSCDDTFEHLIKSTATINLVTKDYVGDFFFAANADSMTMEITINGAMIFSGFVDPNTFNQPFVAGLDEFSITGLDKLSVLQYQNYLDCNINNYQQQADNADSRTFKYILDDILDLSNNMLIYDNSKGISSTRTQYVFDDLTVYDLLFYGEDFDDVWTKDEVLEALLKYLNLHIINIGDYFYVFDWDTIKSGRSTWRYITSEYNTPYTINHQNLILAQPLFAASDTNITIDDVYTQVKLKCNLEKQDTLIDNPLDDKQLTSPYTGKQLYMTEYISEGSGDHAHDAMIDMINDRHTTYDKAKTIDWYMQVKQSEKWKLNIDGAGGHDIFDISGIRDGENYINQWKIPKYLKDHQCIPAILSLGTVETKGGTVTDNSPVSQIDMKNYLFISVNGNSNDYTSGSQSPTDNTLEAQSPILEYQGMRSGGVFSPVDDETTNYIVFSGKMLLQPIQWESGQNNVNRNNNFANIAANGMRKTEGVTARVPYYETKPSDQLIAGTNIIKSQDNEEGRYYTRKFFSIVNPRDEVYPVMNEASMQPWTKDKSGAGFEYHYSATGEGNDLYSKIPLLECELIIGNKRLIETNIDMYGNSTFEWVTIGEEPDATYVDENNVTRTYKVTTFSLGIDPKIDDNIIGTEFDIQNTINYQMNIDATGTAIPIKRSDNLSGKVQFKVIGLINTTWNQITRRHPTFFRHTKWTENVRFLLAHTENIIIEKFECKVYSDNSMYDSTTKNKDLIYMSDENDNFINKKDNIEFDIVTQLSADECREKGITTSILMNAVGNAYSATDNTYSLMLTELYNANTEETAKAEEHYIDQYYNQYSSPKIELETTLHDNSLAFNDLFHSNVLDKNFHVLSMNKNLRYHTNTVKLREL